MAESRSRLVGYVQTQRIAIVEVVITGVLLAVGINVLSTILGGRSEFARILIAIGAVLASIVILILIRFHKTKEEVSIQGFIIHDEESNDLLEVPNYDLSEWLNETLAGILNERVDLHDQWNRFPLHGFVSLREDGVRVGRPRYTAYDLVQEVIDYIVLNRLQLHLSTYFSGFKEGQMITIDRNNLDKSILDNEVFSTITAPVHDRIWLPNEVRHSEESMEENVVFAISPHFTFSRFSLALPKGSRLYRSKEGFTVVENRSFSVKFKTTFVGLSTNIPFSFIRDYIKYSNGDSQNPPYLIRIDVSCKLRWFSLFSLRGWKLHAWADSYLDDLEESLSSDRFFKKIGWDTVEAMLRSSGEGRVRMMARRIHHPIGISESITKE